MVSERIIVPLNSFSTLSWENFHRNFIDLFLLLSIWFSKFLIKNLNFQIFFLLWLIFISNTLVFQSDRIQFCLSIILSRFSHSKLNFLTIITDCRKDGPSETETISAKTFSKKLCNYIEFQNYHRSLFLSTTSRSQIPNCSSANSCESWWNEESGTL